MIDGFLWSYFLPPQNGWLPTTSGCLSNWEVIVPSVHTWRGTYASTVLLGWTEDQMFFFLSVHQKPDVIILQCFPRFLCITPVQHNHPWMFSPRLHQNMLYMSTSYCHSKAVAVCVKNGKSIQSDDDIGSEWMVFWWKQTDVQTSVWCFSHS